MSSVRLPRTTAERSALEAFKARTTSKVAAIVGVLRRGQVIPSISGAARIYDGPSGPEPVMVVSFSLSEAVDRGLELAERRLREDLRDWFVHQGMIVGGVPCSGREVWIRGEAIGQQRAA